MLWPEVLVVILFKNTDLVKWLVVLFWPGVG